MSDVSNDGVKFSVQGLEADIKPLGFYSVAKEFNLAAKLVHAGGEFQLVTYYLIGHSLELIFKAFLLANGVAVNDLRKKGKFGHDLEKLFLETKRLGVSSYVNITPEDEQHLILANSYYNGKEFEYFDTVKCVTGYPNLPDLCVLERLADKLLDNLYQLCL
ncbi:MAG: hypothetical protein EOO68_20625 [Moraxellaceae bacterium]|nr:MAG: hypothetical protein EOO68_20625 [Moraxellaceae bacterium]